MRKLFKMMGLMLLAVAIGFGMLLGAIALDWSDGACIGVYFFGSLMSALALGVFDVQERRAAKSASVERSVKSEKLAPAA